MIKGSNEKRCPVGKTRNRPVDETDEDSRPRLAKWVQKFKTLSSEQQEAELQRVRRESVDPSRNSRYSYLPDLSRVPGDLNEDVSGGEFDEAEMSDKIKALVLFVRRKFGKKCAHAAIAVMRGCSTGAEIGAHMGISRQSGDCHLEKLQSKAVQNCAVKLGLVTRPSFLKTVELRGRPRKNAKGRNRKVSIPGVLKEAGRADGLASIAG